MSVQTVSNCSVVVDVLNCCVYLELFAAIPFVGHVIPHTSPSPLLPTKQKMDFEFRD